VHPTLIHNRGGRTRPIAEIAAAEKIDESYVGRVLRWLCWRQTLSRRFWMDDSRPK